ncbi:MAG: UPF0280 family protein [Magnetospirillum sp.]|nr:UPF0280 family protein [Magnetospirillum sp.]
MPLLPDGHRLHLNHGPIDVVLAAWGPPGEVARAYDQVEAAFGAVLPALARELPVLRSADRHAWDRLEGPVARAMARACRRFPDVFLTPMAAVAGAVADHLRDALVAGRALAKAYVNDGGDIAVHLTPGENLVCGVVGDLAAPALDARIRLSSELGIGGVATSGRATKGQGGRSFSLGIADAVTVLAADAATADAAATAIANAVDLPGHPAVCRRPAVDLDPDSDLGPRPVTVGLGALTADEIAMALDNGVALAEQFRSRGAIAGAYLTLRGQRRITAVSPLALAA